MTFSFQWDNSLGLPQHLGSKVLYRADIICPLWWISWTSGEKMRRAIKLNRCRRHLKAMQLESDRQLWFRRDWGWTACWKYSVITLVIYNVQKTNAMSAETSPRPMPWMYNFTLHYQPSPRPAGFNWRISEAKSAVSLVSAQCKFSAFDSFFRHFESCWGMKCENLIHLPSNLHIILGITQALLTQINLSEFALMTLWMIRWSVTNYNC